MSVRMTKPWIEFTADTVARLPGVTGIYEIADRNGTLLDIGYAGGRSLFGLRSELERQLAALGDGYTFRYEVNIQYMSRFHELINITFADRGCLPARLEQRGVRATGRIRPN